MSNLEELSIENYINNATRFEPLLGLYDVAYVLKARKQDNPVGGKWTRQSGLAQRLLQTRRTFQHLLPVNTTGLCNPSLETVVAEAVNVISLEALWGLIRLTVILRGDAVPLTNEEQSSNKIPLTTLAVRAYFDAPRIVLGKLGRVINVYLGPTSSVVLDSTYVDKRVRIGMGGFTGTRFVFKRCPDNDDEAMKFKPLIMRRPVRKSRALTVLCTLGGISLYGAMTNRKLRLIGLFMTGLASLLGFALISSDGGIIRDEMYRNGLTRGFKIKS